MKYILILGLVTLATFVSGRAPCVDCGKEVRDSNLRQVEESLKEALNKLVTGVAPNNGMDKIAFGAKLVMDGLTEKVKADFKDESGNPKPCEVHIYLEPQMKNEYSVTITCLGEKPVVKTYSL